MEQIRLSEVIGAMSYALDIVEGQAMGHALRTCLIGMRLGDEVGLDPDRKAALFYALLLKDSGCSSNAAKVSSLFAADDFLLKREMRLMDRQRLPVALGYLFRYAAHGRPLRERAAAIANAMRRGAEGSRELTLIRCERGADIARSLGFAEDAAVAIRNLDEHWNGRGYPDGLKRDEIPLLARILGLAQVVEVFHDREGREAALAVARERSGRWFDPALVAALERLPADDRLWVSLESGDVERHVGALEPPELTLLADDARIDGVCEAFARVIDAKSPYTYRHSERVAEIAEAIGRELRLPAAELRDLRRAGLLHDIGKLAVSSRILDKPGKLDDDEFAAVRVHPLYTLRILERVECFRGIAVAAAAHHERIDGRGYHLGLAGDAIPAHARILAVADVFEALTADRPYRAALPAEEALAILERDLGTAFCPAAFHALCGALGRHDALAVAA